MVKVKFENSNSENGSLSSEFHDEKKISEEYITGEELIKAVSERIMAFPDRKKKITEE